MLHAFTKNETAKRYWQSALKPLFRELKRLIIDAPGRLRRKFIGAFARKMCQQERCSVESCLTEIFLLLNNRGHNTQSERLKQSHLQVPILWQRPEIYGLTVKTLTVRKAKSTGA